MKKPDHMNGQVRLPGGSNGIKNNHPGRHFWQAQQRISVLSVSFAPPG